MSNIILRFLSQSPLRSFPTSSPFQLTSHTLHRTSSRNSGLTGDDWTVEKRPVGSEVEGKGSGRREGLDVGNILMALWRDGTMVCEENRIRGCGKILGFLGMSAIYVFADDICWVLVFGLFGVNKSTFLHGWEGCDHR